MRLLGRIRSPAVVRPPELSVSLRYAAAPSATAVAFAVHLTVFPEPTLAPFLMFFLAVTVASWLGGWGPGLLSTVLSSAVCNYRFLPPFDEFNLNGPSLAATLLFTAIAASIAVLCGSLRNAQQKAEHRARLLDGTLADQKRTEEALRSGEQELAAM